jgi:primosomal protein N'
LIVAKMPPSSSSSLVSLALADASLSRRDIRAGERW